MEALKAVKLEKKSGRIVKKADSLIQLIRSMQTEELVVAFSGALGSGTSFVAERFVEELRSHGYSSRYIKVSDLIVECYKDDERVSNINRMNKPAKTRILQILGDELRKNNTNDYLAQLAISDIAIERVGYSEENVPGEGEEPRSRRVVTVVDSLKHPDEYTLLNAIYGDMFYMVGVLCPEVVRKKRLEDDSQFSPIESTELMEKDKDEGKKYGQKLLKTLQHSDFFIRNIANNAEKLDSRVRRYVEFMLGSTRNTPTVHEYAMHAAYGASLRSGCMSRQVGAAILGASGDLLSTGRNDVPRGGGGLYGPEDKGNDARCVYRAGGKCESDERKGRIHHEIMDVFNSAIGSGEIEEDAQNAILSVFEERLGSMDNLKALIEYSRAVHAEMDAITTVARNGCSSLKGASLYCTTFPCHHCARHIVASGFSKVYYIEPYE